MHFGEEAAENVLVYEDFSGGNLERPQFKKMMKDSQKIAFAAIVVYRLDRISRNIGDFAECAEFDGEHGIMVYNRSLQRPGKANQIRPMEEWIVAVGKHPGIIAGSDWVRVQAMLDVNKSKSYRRPRSNVALLSGLLRCGECGDYMRPKLTNRKNADDELIYTYMCSTKERSHGTVCSMKNCNGNTLDAKIIEEIRKLGNVILVIDEVRSIVGAGDAEGSMNAANILKPALSRGEIQVIGATTFNEYRKYIEKDQALERRFQPVRVEEPSVADTLAVMGGIKHYYEEHHHVQVPADVLNATVTLSERYITDRYLPDKAIDLLDEACACCNLAHPVISEYLTMQKELEALKQEEADMENADVNEPIDYERVAERKTRMAQLERELPAKQAAAGEIQVTMDDVAKVIELWTGIPAVKIRETEYAKLASLETELKKKIIGQDDAVHLVAQAVKRSRADLSGRRRPASFIFVGPTGVGKTELVKQLANQLFDGPDPLIRLDMSEYMEKYAVSRMIGSPPGYVGYEEAGQLTEKVRRRPYSVVLFDEIEKAHPDVMNILLQILDEGKINDAQGRTVDFSNTVICMTSNAGSSDQTTASLGFNRSEEERNEEKSRKALSQFLRPEFLGRVDEVITFKPLSEETLQGIAALMLDEYKPSMEAKGIAYSYTPAALAALVHKSQGGKFGARDLRRTIRKAVEDPAAEKIIDGTLVSGSTLTVDAENDEIVLK